MSRTRGSIALILSKTGGPPFLGSVGYVNDALAPILSRNGWHVRAFQPPRPTQAQEAMLPLALAGQLLAVDGATPPDIALFDAGGMHIRSPIRGWARRNVMLYHGLAYGGGTWMISPDIDLHCANSLYLERSLRAFFAFPNWHARRCLNQHGLGALTNIPLPVPCVDHVDGHPGFAYGADLPVHVQHALGSNMVWGHALQPGKQDWFATLAILYWLNVLRSGSRWPRIALFVPEGSPGKDLRAALDAMLPPGQTCSDYFFEIPLLKQQVLFQVIRACRFALAYNQFPEPFGFYVLESVHNGCPVYTNGAGNNRFLLPPGHGVQIQETFAMAPGPDGDRDSAPYRAVAERILGDLGRADDIAAECSLGATLIRERWSLAAFERGLVGVLARLDDPTPPIPEFEYLRVHLSPFIRGLDQRDGRCLSDYMSTTIPPATLAATIRLLGQACRDLPSEEMHRLEATHHLFSGGILTLAPASAGVPDAGIPA